MIHPQLVFYTMLSDSYLEFVLQHAPLGLPQFRRRGNITHKLAAGLVEDSLLCLETCRLDQRSRNQLRMSSYPTMPFLCALKTLAIYNTTTSNNSNSTILSLDWHEQEHTKNSTRLMWQFSLLFRRRMGVAHRSFLFLVTNFMNFIIENRWPNNCFREHSLQAESIEAQAEVQIRKVRHCYRLLVTYCPRQKKQIAPIKWSFRCECLQIFIYFCYKYLLLLCSTCLLILISPNAASKNQSKIYIATKQQRNTNTCSLKI